MGRRKIEIQPLNDDRNRTVTFVKRKAGLFKKAYELSVLCKVDLAVIIVGNNNKVYEFSSVDTKELMAHYSKQSPHESKSPENYGRYKKKARVPRANNHSVDDDTASIKEDDNGDSDYESEPEPSKKRKIESSIYAKQPAGQPGYTGMGAAQNQHPKGEPESQPPPLQPPSQQRPVLRVQIPSDAKALDSANLTPNDAIKETSANSTELQSSQPPPLSSARYAFGKFKSPDTKRPQLPKSQTSSPSSTSVPQLPMNPAFFSSLPQPSPSGQYPPSILPTPVFNQVFNQQYMGQFGPMGVPPGGSSGGVSGVGAMPTTNSGPSSSQIPQSSHTQSAPDGSSSGTSNGGDSDGPRFKPPFQQAHMNGEQTPVSGLPSRYMSDIFPSPSNLYPAQEWPSSMTPYSSNMTHYFGGMPSSNGSGPPTAVYANSSRNPQMANQRPGAQHQNTSNPQQPLREQQQSSPSSTQPPDFGHYYKK